MLSCSKDLYWILALKMDVIYKKCWAVVTNVVWNIERGLRGAGDPKQVIFKFPTTCHILVAALDATCFDVS
jgi:hypothetical protein